MAIDSDGAQNRILSLDLSKHLSPIDRSFSDISQEPRSVQIMGKSPSFSSNVKTGSSLAELSFRASSSWSVSEEINGIASNVAGILCKWVNYGKGWRPRWFVLQDGVLSYYKVHGPNKISVNLEQRGFHIVGDAPLRYLGMDGDANTSSQLQRALGELHLKVSSIRKSQTDGKKFYIFTGTKTLHLRTFTQEDRRIWLDSLQTAKNLLLKIPVTQEIIPPLEGTTVSTKALRSHLIKEGMNDAAIAKSEEIMTLEFQNHLKLLQHNYNTVVEKLKLMEAEKTALETTVVGKHLDEQDNSRPLGHERDGGATDLDTDIEKHGEDSDDAYFDANEFFSYCQNTTTDLPGNFSDLDDAFTKPKCDPDSSMDLIGFNYPYVKRRKKLPEPKEQEKGFSLWSLIKDNIGKDLTKVCLPVYFNEPISSLQKCFEDLEYSYLLDQAYEWGKRGNSLMRLLNVAAFAVSGYASTGDRTCKPFNPLLGETYEADFPDKGLRFVSEKVSHHPMIVACHCDGQGWKFWGDSTVKSRFWGRSIQVEPVGILTLEFDDGETFQWSKVTTSIYNLILGKIYCDHYGTMRIQGNRGISCRLKFKEQSIMDRNSHQVQGFAYDENGQKSASLFGKWDESMYYVNGDLSVMPKGYDPMSEGVLLWERNESSKFLTRYNLTSFAITLNEITPGLMENLPPTDSRLRPDQRYLENGEYEKAFEEKLRLEEKQRMSRKLQESGWKPRWFHKENGADTYKYIGGYWEARCKRQWESCPNIFGPELSELPHK